jgi:hypothetical protein
VEDLQEYDCVGCRTGYLLTEDQKDQTVNEDDKTIICLDCQQEVFNAAVEAMK